DRGDAPHPRHGPGGDHRGTVGRRHTGLSTVVGRQGEGVGTTARYEIAEIDSAEFGSRLCQLIRVYAAAMRPSAEQLAGRHPIMVMHASYPGFRALIGTVDDEVAGFCYGFHGEAGQWWHDRVSYGLAALHGLPTARRWL